MDIHTLKSRSRDKKAIDEFIGIVYRKDDQTHFRYRRNYKDLFIPASLYREYAADSGASYDGVIVWIIESPHKWEFRIDIPLYPEGRHRARPLNNPSTQSYVKPVFDDHMGDFLANNIGEGQVYLVLLVNSVEYQCSLGENTSLYRDKNFISNWIDDERDHFLQKISSYKGDLYINSCTKGSINKSFLQRNYDLTETLHGDFYFKEIDGSLSLNGMVEAELERNGYIDRDNYIRYPHPSYFVYQENKGRTITFPEAETLSPTPLLSFGVIERSIQLTIT